MTDSYQLASKQPYKMIFFSVFQDLPISPYHYLKNVANHRSFARQMELRDFFRSPKRGSWNDFSHMANIATVVRLH